MFGTNTYLQVSLVSINGHFFKILVVTIITASPLVWHRKLPQKVKYISLVGLILVNAKVTKM